MQRRNRPCSTRWPETSADSRLSVSKHLEVLDPQNNPIPGVFAIGDNAMPVSGRLPATAQGMSSFRYTTTQNKEQI